MKILWFLDKQFDVALDRNTKIEVIKSLQRTHTVRLITGYRDQPVQFPGLHSEIVYLDSSHVPYVNRLITYCRQLAVCEKQVESYRPDVVLFNTNNVLLLRKIVRFQRKYGYRSILDVRTLPVSSGPIDHGVDCLLFKKCVHVAARHFSGVTYITEAMKDYCIDRYRLPPHKCSTWSSGVDAEHFYAEPRNEKDTSFRVLYHGTVADNRGIDQAVRAIGLLADLDIRLTVLGAGNGVKLLERIIDDNRLGGRVTLAPPVPYAEIPRQIAKADMGVLPFPVYDGWNVSSPIKLFEYLSCGRPVIVTNIRAHRDVLGDKPFAFWSNGNSPDELAAAIRRAFKDRDRLAALGAEGRRFVLDRYTWEKQAKRLNEFISSLS